MRKRRWLVWLLILCLVLIPAATAFADVGGGVDHDIGDWGGGSHGGGGGGGGDGLFYVAMMLLRGGPVGIGTLVIIAVVIFLSSKKRSSSRSSQSYSTGQRAETKGTDINLNALLQRDPNFSKDDFLARAGDVFITLQNAWTEKNWKSIRAFESNQLFHQHEQQLAQYIRNHQTNVVEDITVLETSIEEYREDANNQTMTVILRGRYRDYIVDDATGKVIKGDRNKKYLMTYRMTFQRKLTATTHPGSQTSVTSCPNCGANLSINQNGICEYCGSEVTTGAMQWVLTSLQPLAQQTV